MRVRASGGRLQNELTPVTIFPAPTAKVISVKAGEKQTTELFVLCCVPVAEESEHAERDVIRAIIKKSKKSFIKKSCLRILVMQAGKKRTAHAS